MEDIQVIPSCHDGGMISLIQSHALLLVILASLNLKASVGMYSRCDYPLQILFVFFDPAIPTSSFNFIQLFLYLFLFFFIAHSAFYQRHLTWLAVQCNEVDDGRC